MKTLKILIYTILAALPLSALAQEPADSCDTFDDFDAYDEMLAELVVTAVRTPKLLEDVPVQTIVLGAKDIKRADATNIQDLLQSEMPGIEFSYAMNQQMHMNFGGFGGQSVLFLLNGERLAGETMDDVDFSRLDMGNVERIEIVRGASSALFGSNAGGGVINIITKDAVRPWDLTLDARVGSHYEQRYGATLTNKLGKVSNVLSGSYYNIKNFDVESDPDPVTRVFATVYGNRTWSVKDELSVTPMLGMKLSAHASYFFRQVPRYVDTPERYRDYAGGLRGSWDINDANRLNLSYSFDQYDKSDYRRATDLDVRSYSNVQNSVRGLYTHTFASGDALTAGGDYCHEYLMNSKLQGQSYRQHNADAFVQYDWIANDLWEAVAALRYDYFSDGDKSRLTPKVSVRYRPLRRLNLRASYGMGFRAPTLKEKYYEFDMAGIWIVKGNPELKPETSHNFNLSMDYTRGKYNVTLAGYYNRVEDKITTGLPYSTVEQPNQLYMDYVNLQGYSIFGADFTVQGRWNNGLSAKLAYSFCHERKALNTDGSRANNQYMPTRPHSLTMRADWEHNFSAKYTFTASINGRILSAVDHSEYKDYYDIAAGTTEVRYPAYTLWKLAVAQTLGSKLTLRVTVDNLFNYRPKYYYMNAPLTDGTTFQVGLSMHLF